MRSYLLSLICAGVICCTASYLFREKSGVGKLVKMLCGLFMTIALLSPLKQIDIRSVDLLQMLQSSESQSIIAQGQQQADDALQEVIIEYCSTYIVEKAKGMGVDIDVQFQLNNADPPIPTAAVITGSVSPYTKAKLITILEQELGIPEDQQTWN